MPNCVAVVGGRDAGEAPSGDIGRVSLGRCVSRIGEGRPGGLGAGTPGGGSMGATMVVGGVGGVMEGIASGCC
jgi:hypothetical protein